MLKTKQHRNENREISSNRNAKNVFQSPRLLSTISFNKKCWSVSFQTGRNKADSSAQEKRIKICTVADMSVLLQLVHRD